MKLQAENKLDLTTQSICIHTFCSNLYHQFSQTDALNCACQSCSKECRGSTQGTSYTSRWCLSDLLSGTSHIQPSNV